MRSILVIVLFGALLAFPGVNAAEDGECQTHCADEKAANETACPPAGDATDQARSQCLRESEDAYAACVNNCGQPAPAPAPEEN